MIVIISRQSGRPRAAEYFARAISVRSDQFQSLTEVNREAAVVKISRGRAVWSGDKHGHGYVTTASGSLAEAQMTLERRFGEAKGANPEELIAAAHAGCFAMDVAISLTDLGYKPQELRATADLKLVSEEGNVFIASSHIELLGIADDVPYDLFKDVVEKSIRNCPVSKLLKAAITLDWKLQRLKGRVASSNLDSDRASDN